MSRTGRRHYLQIYFSGWLAKPSARHRIEGVDDAHLATWFDRSNAGGSWRFSAASQRTWESDMASQEQSRLAKIRLKIVLSLSFSSVFFNVSFRAYASRWYITHYIVNKFTTKCWRDALHILFYLHGDGELQAPLRIGSEKRKRASRVQDSEHKLRIKPCAKLRSNSQKIEGWISMRSRKPVSEKLQAVQPFDE